MKPTARLEYPVRSRPPGRKLEKAPQDHARLPPGLVANCRFQEVHHRSQFEKRAIASVAQTFRPVAAKDPNQFRLLAISTTNAAKRCRLREAKLLKRSPRRIALY